MVCFPLSNSEANFIKVFRRHYAEHRESYYFEDQLPMSAETCKCIQVYSIKNVQQLRRYYGGTSEYDMTDYAWVFGTLLNFARIRSRGYWAPLRVLTPPRTGSCTFPGPRWTTSGGLQYLAHLDVYHQRFEDGLVIVTMTAEALDLTKMGLWSLYGFSCYVLQCVRGLAERPVGPYCKPREGFAEIPALYVRVGDKYANAAIFCPEHFPRARRSRTSLFMGSVG